MSKVKSRRHEELELLSTAIPNIRKYGPALQPDGSDYRYCSVCRVYFTKNAESLITCPICRHRLRGARKARRVKRRIDPTMYGVG